MSSEDDIKHSDSVEHSTSTPSFFAAPASVSQHGESAVENDILEATQLAQRLSSRRSRASASASTERTELARRLGVARDGAAAALQLNTDVIDEALNQTVHRAVVEDVDHDEVKRDTSSMQSFFQAQPTVAETAAPSPELTRAVGRKRKQQEVDDADAADAEIAELTMMSRGRNAAFGRRRGASVAAEASDQVIQVYVDMFGHNRNALLAFSMETMQEIYDFFFAVAGTSRVPVDQVWQSDVFKLQSYLLHAQNDIVDRIVKGVLNDYNMTEDEAGLIVNRLRNKEPRATSKQHAAKKRRATRGKTLVSQMAPLRSLMMSSSTSSFAAALMNIDTASAAREGMSAKMTLVELMTNGDVWPLFVQLVSTTDTAQAIASQGTWVKDNKVIITSDRYAIVMNLLLDAINKHGRRTGVW